MNVTNQDPENDSLKVNYDEESGEIQLSWDPDDTKWNWLATLPEDEVRDMITKEFEKFIEETQDGTSDPG
jgi:hypothetical protein